MWCVYLITNTCNGNIYFGKTDDIRARWNQHNSDSNLGKKPYRLYRSMNKYGACNFTVEVFEKHETELEALDAEVFWIAYYRSIGAVLLNMTKGGEGISGFKHSEESKARMSQNSAKHFLGKHHTEETKAVMSELKTGIYIGEGNPFYGKKHSAESLEKIAAAHVNKTHSDETRAKMSLSNKRSVLIIAYTDHSELRYNSIRAAGKALGIDGSYLAKAVRKGKSIKGYKFRYEETT